jgi:hypothetical protein
MKTLIWYLIWFGVLLATEATLCQKTLAADAGLNHPISFGYKTAWFAVHSCEPQKVASSLGLTDISSATWKAGFDAIDNEEANFTATSNFKTVFVTPSLSGWTFAIGFALLKNVKAHSSALPISTLKKLSEICGQAQFYASYRVVDWYAWSLAKNGTIVRAYEYSGSEGETLSDVGALTPVEKGINFQALDEDGVLKIARAWSIDPSNLNESITTPLGLLGQIRRTQ